MDFSAHMVHSFMHAAPPLVHGGEELRSAYCNRQHRMRVALDTIAPAILHGGLSTLLAVALLSFSDVYVFVAFFKVWSQLKLFLKIKFENLMQSLIPPYYFSDFRVGGLFRLIQWAGRTADSPILLRTVF